MSGVKANSYKVYVFMRDTRLSIPFYQRPYVWDEEDAALTLIEDIQEAFECQAPGSDSLYFIGNVMLIENEHNEGDKEFEIADGQQRLTTLLILLGRLQAHVLRKKNLSQKDLQLANFVANSMLKKEAGPGETITCIRSPYTEVQEALVRLANGEMPPELSTKSKQSKRLLRAYTHVACQVDDWLKDNKGLDLAAFLDFVINKVQLVAITYPDASTALACFESLNSKGRDLIQSDLLKSAFMKQVPQEKWENVSLAWQEIMDIVGQKKNGEDSFLRTASMAVLFPAFASAKDAPAKSQLLQRVTTYCHSHAIGVDELLKKMAAFANNRVALTKDIPAYPGNVQGQVLSRLRWLPKTPDFLLTLLAVIPASLPLASKEKVAKMLEAVACVIAISRQSKNINYAIQPFCVELRTLEQPQVTAFCSRLSETLIRPHLTLFKDSFRLLDVSQSTHKRWVRYLLWVVEDYLREGLSKTPLNYGDGTRGARKAHLEHIVAKAREAELGARMVNQIGNITLLEPTKNTSLGAGTVADKRGQYQSSEFCLTIELGETQHGNETTARLFLDSPLVKPLWAYSTFDGDAISARTSAIAAVLMAYWDLSSSSVPTAPLITESLDVSESTEQPVTLTVPATTASAIPESRTFLRPAKSAPRIRMGSLVKIGYLGRDWKIKLVNASYAASSNEFTQLDIRKEGDFLLGMAAGEKVRGRLFSLQEGLIEVLDVTGP